jgi:hypothetical protein
VLGAPHAAAAARPRAWGEGFLRADPLGIAGPILARTSPLGLTPGARDSDRRLRGPDGRSLLLMFDSPVPMTDFGRARAMQELLQATAAALPAGVALKSVSGHQYTLANSQTIRRISPPSDARRWPSSASTSGPARLAGSSSSRPDDRALLATAGSA